MFLLEHIDPRSIFNTAVAVGEANANANGFREKPRCWMRGEMFYEVLSMVTTRFDGAFWLRRRSLLWEGRGGEGRWGGGWGEVLVHDCVSSVTFDP